MARKMAKKAKRAPAKKAAPVARKPAKVTATAGKTVTASALMQSVAEHMGLKKTQAKDFVDGYLDVVKAPHTAVKNPVTGWPVKYSQQHEDFHLAAQRGMPGPFDNGVMRFAWVCPLLTNWMGDAATLKRLYVQVRTPGIYGDTTWYRGTVAEKLDGGVVKIRITGINQVGITTTTGEAEVVLPTRSGRSS